MGGGGVVGVTWISSKHLHFQQAPSPSTNTFFLSLCFKLLFQASLRSNFFLSLCLKLLFQGPSLQFFLVLTNTFFIIFHLLSFSTPFFISQNFVPTITFFFFFISSIFSYCHYLRFEDPHHHGVS
jgi:hypothetical protein